MVLPNPLTLSVIDNGLIRAEADRLLQSGLRDLLAEYGEVHLMGSYALGLLTWRDLDIHIVPEQLDLAACFGLGGRLAALLRPHRMHFRDETVTATPGLPRGLYWGIYLGDERAGGWKLDIWLSDREGFEPARRFGEELAARLNEENRRVILALKAACWNHPQYRRSFGSADIYAAVLDRGVRDIGGFWRDLKASIPLL